MRLKKREYFDPLHFEEYHHKKLKAVVIWWGNEKIRYFTIYKGTLRVAGGSCQKGYRSFLKNLFQLGASYEYILADYQG